MLTKNPAEEAPVNSRNFFRIPFTFSLTVKTISATPNKKKATPEMIRNQRNIGPLNAGTKVAMENTLAMITKTPTSAQNIGQLNFPFALSVGVMVFINLTPCVPLSFKGEGEESF